MMLYFAAYMTIISQWEFPDPKMEVLYNIKSYVGGTYPYTALADALCILGTSNLGHWDTPAFCSGVKIDPGHMPISSGCLRFVGGAMCWLQVKSTELLPYTFQVQRILSALCSEYVNTYIYIYDYDYDYDYDYGYDYDYIQLCFTFV